MINISPPNRFTGLHCHGNFSTFDGLGYPAEHIDFITSEAQGMDSWALTDHGNGSGLAHARIDSQKIIKKGKKFRQLYGVEFYFVPSLTDWARQMEEHQQSIKAAKSSKVAESLAQEPTIVKPPDEDEEAGGHVIENEEETKASKGGKPEWKRYYHLVVIAKNRVGIGNLFALVKKSFKYGFYRFPRIDYKMLKEHGEGLIVSTACVGGLASGLIYREFPELKFADLTPDLLTGPAAESAFRNIRGRLDNMIDRFTDCVGRDNFFLEMQFNELSAQHLTNRCLLDASIRTGVQLVSTADSHFPSPDKWQARELYKKLGWIGANLEGQKLPTREEMKTLLYPKNASQMWDEFKRGWSQYDFYRGHEELVKSSIERTHDIAWNVCEDAWIDTGAKLPKFDRPEKTAFQQLAELCKDAMIAEGLADKPEYLDRIKEELSDVKYLKFENYFLTLHAIFKEAENQTLLGCARGSGGGSLINYLLKITQVDPVEHKLMWARFLGRHKVSWPDVDSDAADRDVFINVAKNLFGEEAVIPVSNFNTLQLKSLIKDISKFYGIPFEEVNAMTGPLIDEVMSQAKDENTEKGLFVLLHDDCMKYSKGYREFMEKYPEVHEHVATLFKQNRSIGRHAGGVLIAPPELLERTMPLISVRGELQTPWSEGVNFRHLEDNGFLKFDFLGLALIRDVQNCIGRILKKRLGREPEFLEIKEFFDKNLNCRYVKADDQKVWEYIYHQRRKVGIFQFTESGARKFCEDSKPRNITELAAITSIFRPGPLKAGVHNQWVEVVSGKKTPQYDHPIIKEVLEETHGFIVFQEDFMLLSQKVAGFSPGESDKMRKTLVKKSHDATAGKVSERDELRKKFIDGAVKKSGFTIELATKLIDMIEYFAAYGFNRAHAVAYAFDSYYAAWLHTHYEKEWLMTILQKESSSPDGLAKTINEIKAYGYQFAQADINHSGDEWDYSDEIGAFVPPLGAVKGVGGGAMNEIIQNRPYKNLDSILFDYNGDWKPSKINKTALVALCKIEAFGSLEEFKSGKIKNHRQLLHLLTDSNNYETLKKGKWGLTKTALKKKIAGGETPRNIIDSLLDGFDDMPDWSRGEKIGHFIDLTSASPAALVFPDHVMDIIRRKDIPSALDLSPGQKAIAWFCVTNAEEKKTKKGSGFVKLDILDHNSKTGVVRVWGKLNAENVEPYTLWIAEVKKDDWGLSAQSWHLKMIDTPD